MQQRVSLRLVLMIWVLLRLLLTIWVLLHLLRVLLHRMCLMCLKMEAAAAGVAAAEVA